MIRLLPHQQPPAGDWKEWLLAGGRGAGLTFAMIGFVHEVAQKDGGQRIIVAAYDKFSAREISAEGESGLLARYSEHYVYHRTPPQARHSNGTVILFRGLDEPVCREKPYDLLAVDMLKYCNPDDFEAARKVAQRVVSNSVPMTAKEIETAGRDWVRAYAESGIAFTRAPSLGNTYLSERYRELLAQRYVGKPEEQTEFAGRFEGERGQA